LRGDEIMKKACILLLSLLLILTFGLNILAGPNEEAQKYFNEGKDFYNNSDYKNALKGFKKSLDLYIEAGSNKSAANLYDWVANTYVKLGECETAIPYYEKSANMDKQTGEKATEAYSLHQIGYTYYSCLSQYEKAIAYFEKALTIRERLLDEKEQAKILRLIGLCYSKSSFYEKAISYYERALKKYVKVGDKLNKSYVLIDIGAAKYQQKKYSEALSYFEDSKKIKKEIGDSKESIKISNDWINAVYDELTPSDSDTSRELKIEWAKYLIKIQDYGMVTNWEGLAASADLTRKNTNKNSGPIPKYLKTNIKDTVTVNTVYTKATPELAQTIIKSYKSIPGGITLEGLGTGLEGIIGCTYNSALNRFSVKTSKGSFAYDCPVTGDEMRDIVAAIERDDRLGVSLGSTELVYGSMNEHNPVIVYLKLADHFLGRGFVFGGDSWTENYRFANGYVPKKNKTKDAGWVCVYFNFKNYRFAANNGLIKLQGFDFDVTLVPLKNEKGPDGGLLPDYRAIEKGLVSREYEDNIRHLVNNFDYYQNELIIRMMCCYGEAAAFARALKRNGVDLNKLVNIRTADKPTTPTTPPPPSTSDAAKEWFSKAYDATDNNKKIEYYTKAIGLNPEFSYAYNNRGNAYYEQEKYDLAMADYTKAITYDSKNEEAYRNRGNTYYALEKYEQAIVDFTNAIGFDPKNENAYYWRGRAYSELEKYDQAIADYTKTIDCDPNYTIAYNSRGDAYYILKEYNQAIVDYTKAIGLDSENESTYYWRGRAYFELKKYDQAIADYTKAIKYDSKNKEAYRSRGNAYYALKEYDRAISDYTNAIALDPKYVIAYRNRSWAYRKLGRYDRVIADYTKIVELEPNNADNYNERGWNYYIMEEYGKALPDVEKALRIDPNHANALDSRSNILRELKRYDEAMADIEKAIKMNPKHYFFYLTRGKLYEAEGMADKAKADYKRACENGEDEACEALKKLSGMK
jgi:tetratricopeptide (TPR) repeat protein